MPSLALSVRARLRAPGLPGFEAPILGIWDMTHLFAVPEHLQVRGCPVTLLFAPLLLPPLLLPRVGHGSPTNVVLLMKNACTLYNLCYHLRTRDVE